MSAVKDMAGQRFGRLTVIKRCASTPSGQATWICVCDCGTKCFISGANMRKGNTKSCGCLHDKSARERFSKHCKSGTRLNAVWKAMNQRCFNPSDKNYARYGGRGITVCDEWRRDFQAFYEWAMANGYDENAPVGSCTIDRIDNDKGYSPDNCRWVDMKTQNNNKHNRKGQNNEND